MNRMIILLLCFIGLSLFIPQQTNNMIQTFSINNNEAPITKGNTGFSLIFLLTFNNKNLLSFIESPKSENSTFLVDVSFIERNSEIIEVLRKKNRSVGLLGQNSSLYEEDSSLLKEELNIFLKHFDTLPLWFTTKDYLFTEPMLDELYSNGVNAIGPTITLLDSTNINNLEKGSFIYIPIDSSNTYYKNEIDLLTSNRNYTSIEDNIFNIQIRSKDSPS